MPEYTYRKNQDPDERRKMSSPRNFWLNQNTSKGPQGGTYKKDNTGRDTRDGRVYVTPKRVLWYVCRTALILALIVSLLSVAFFFAMDASNIYIIVTEGMTLRMACTLGDGDPNEMYEYFLSDFIRSDSQILSNPYMYYDIETYDYRLDINGLGLFPFASSATMTVTERVPSISGKADANASTATVPDWTPGRYTVSCTKVEGRWFISDVKLIEENPPEPVRPTPDMSLLTVAPTTEPPMTETPEVTDTTETPEATGD